MPNIKSASKRMRQAKVRQTRNAIRKNLVKTLSKSIEKLVSEKKVTEAEALLPKYYQAVDKAVSVNVLALNTGARRKKSVSALLAKAKKAA